MVVKVLLIEDEPSISKIVQKLLSHSVYNKFDITFADTLKKGLKLLKDNKFDCILLDLMLPNSRGLETFKRVHKACPDCAVIILSGYPEDGIEAVRAGAQDFIPKPEVSTQILERSISHSFERKKIELEEIKKEIQFKDIINSTPLGVHIYELRGNDLIFIGYNPGADKILKVDHSGYVGLKIEEAYPKLEGTEIPDRYREVIRTGKPWTIKRFDYKDEFIEGIFSIHSFKISNNLMATSFDDITERINIEKKLRKSEKKYRDLVAATGAAIYKIDFEQMKFLYVNSVMCDMTGWTKEEFLKISPLDILTKESLKNWFKRYSLIKNEPNLCNIYEYEVVLKNGKTVWVLTNAKFKVNENGEVTGASVVAIDISKRKKAQEEIKRKEEIIFGQLENRIYQWREELVETKNLQTQKLDSIDIQISNMMNSMGVFA